jgi:hypothetical protein
MELLLNILWLMLALVAFVVCGTAPISSARASGACRSRFFVLAACLMALVFPVVSASDDLNALRTDMEESSSSCPSAKKSTGSNSPASGNVLCWWTRFE